MKRENLSIGAWITIAVAVIMITLFVVPVIFGKALGITINSVVGSKGYSYTEMDKPTDPSIVTPALTALKSLGNPEVMDTAIAMCPKEDLIKFYMQTKLPKLQKEWADAGSLNYGPQYKEVKKFNMDVPEAVHSMWFDKVAKTDLELRKLIDKGYTYRVDWKNIEYIGFTHVVPDIAMEAFVRLYFKDQDRIFSITYTALIGPEEPKTFGAILEDPNFIRVDNAAGDNIKSIIKQIIN